MRDAIIIPSDPRHLRIGVKLARRRFSRLLPFRIVFVYCQEFSELGVRYAPCWMPFGVYSRNARCDSRRGSDCLVYDRGVRSESGNEDREVNAGETEDRM